SAGRGAPRRGDDVRRSIGSREAPGMPGRLARGFGDRSRAGPRAQRATARDRSRARPRSRAATAAVPSIPSTFGQTHWTREGRGSAPRDRAWPHASGGTDPRQEKVTNRSRACQARRSASARRRRARDAETGSGPLSTSVDAVRKARCSGEVVTDSFEENTSSPRVIGVLGGAFDPPHLGHAMMPAYLFARGLVDRVLVAPCA